MSEKYYGNYLGIVVTSAAEDPERRNRVQVWIPSISNTLYKNWNNDNNDKVFFNLNSQDFLQRNVLDSIRNSLPWAECASPLIGGGSAFYTNTNTGSYSPDPAETVVQTGESDAAADFSIPVAEIPSDSEVVEPDLPNIKTGEYPSTTTSSTQSGSSTGEVKPPSENQPDPQIVNFQELKSFAKSTIRGRCIDDGSTGQCLKGASVWAYAITGNERLNRPTGGSAIDIRLGNNSFFQDSGSYKNNEAFPLNYQPKIGDQVLGKNHIITFLGRDSNGKELWYSDFKDKSPARYIQENGWNPNDMVLIRLKGAEDSDTLVASSQQQSSPVPYVNDSIAHRADPPSAFDGAATGTFTTTNIGAKVWVFFYGGDVQKPVYFAQSLDPASNAEAFQTSQT